MPKQPIRQIKSQNLLSAISSVGNSPRELSTPKVDEISQCLEGGNKNEIYDTIFDEEDPIIKTEILHLISQYLHTHGYTQIAQQLDSTLMTQSKLSLSEDEINKIKSDIIAGHWDSVRKHFDIIKQGVFPKRYNMFKYQVLRQQYLELIERKEYQLALTHLTHYIKPLENYSKICSNNEFNDLCYLLTCKSIRSSPAFRTWWISISVAREDLAECFENMMRSSGDLNIPTFSENRLIKLIHQAYKYQITNSTESPNYKPKIKTILHDYKPLVLPNYLLSEYKGHNSNIKSLIFLGNNGRYLVSGGSDSKIILYDLNKNKENDYISSNEFKILSDHNNRVWCFDCDIFGNYLVSGSSSGTIKMWNMDDQNYPCLLQYSISNDIYSVKFSRDCSTIAFGGYDKILYLLNVETQTPYRTIRGHQNSITDICYTNNGKLVITGSKDSTIKMWDILSGEIYCKSIGHYGEITSLSLNMDGNYLLASTKDNTVRLYDLRTYKLINKYKGHQNLSSNFINSIFASNDNLIVSGSEDGGVYLWQYQDHSSPNNNPIYPVNVLQSHSGSIYRVAWNDKLSMLASAGEDGIVRTWSHEYQSND